jgi:hypothetical protein
MQIQGCEKREGHCRVPARLKEEGFRLGQWVSVQRLHKDKLSSKRRQRLNGLGFDWDPFETARDEGFKYLTLYKKREGNCRVPDKHQESGFRLGQWVSWQRHDKDKLPSDHRQRLDELGFVWRVR